MMKSTRGSEAGSLEPRGTVMAEMPFPVPTLRKSWTAVRQLRLLTISLSMRVHVCLEHTQSMYRSSISVFTYNRIP
jgi:hypothetical protein